MESDARRLNGMAPAIVTRVGPIVKLQAPRDVPVGFVVLVIGR
jgi:hypothetical protein